MKKVNKKILLIILVSLLIIAAIIVAYFVLRKKQSAVSNTVAITDNKSNSASASPTVLQYGSRGSEVKRLQTFLNTQLKLLIWKGLPTYNGVEITQLDVDGIFGARTQAVVKWYFNTTTVNINQF